MDKHPADPFASVLTSLPDLSELPGLELSDWQTWFGDAARRIIRWVPEAGVAIFYQSDIRRGGTLIDKGYLVMKAAEREHAALLFHNIVCREPPGSGGHGRPTYAHLIAVTRGAPPRAGPPVPDVMEDAGAMSWSKATGASACALACHYLQRATGTRVVVDPFCGRGTVLAVANALGLDALGVDVSQRCCRASRRAVAPALAGRFWDGKPR